MSIGIVIVNWRSPQLTLRCVESVRAEATALGARIRVVDNGSGDNSATILGAELKPEELVCVSTNRGFAAGVNAGIAALPKTVKYVALLNSDALATPGFLTNLKAVFTDQSVGAATAHIVLSGTFSPAPPGSTQGLADSQGRYWQRTPKGVTMVNSTGNIVDSRGNGQDRDWLRPAGSWKADPEVFGFCGGAAMLRRTALEQVGTLREDFFMYYEDTELSYRLRASNWQIRYAANAVAIHDHGGSAGTKSELFIRCNIRNRLLVATRWANPKICFKAWVYGCVSAILHHRLLGLKAICSALYAAPKELFARF